MKKYLENPFPTEKQELLLHACLSDKSESYEAFKLWKSQTNFEEYIEYGSFRQLPLLYFNLSKYKIEDDLMPRLKGIYRKSWSENQILFHKAANLIRLFSSNEIKTIVLKGIALSIYTFQNFAVRPMADIDIMVPMSKSKQAIELLKNCGWNSADPENDEFYYEFGKSITLIHSDKTELDIHWLPFFECYGIMTENDFWDRAVEIEVSCEKTLILNPVDELLLTFVHGLMFNKEIPIRWISDSIAILHSTHYEIDWKRLIEYAKKFNVVIQLKEALKYLKENFNAQIPQEIYQKVISLKPSFTDKLVFNQAKKKGIYVYHPTFEKIMTIYSMYMKDKQKNNFISKYFGFIQFMLQRTKGKPRFRILIYYISIILKGKGRNSKHSNSIV